MNAQDPRNPAIKSGDHISGYLIEKIVELKEISSILYDLKHLATGARHVHISREDKENTFSVAFKTVPFNSTGVAHILEHTVLCGSTKFPVRDPFFSMLKRSLSTFMNAFTASDWTMYPFSTQNRKDYYNLMDVYLDSAFFPNLDELSFKQEGHRLEKKSISSPGNNFELVYKGVVYNEMKGAMSSPDQVMARSILNALYPDVTYGFNSGGDPVIIPKLTHAQLKEFHQSHYHPSNAFFYTYGNLCLKDHLAFIENKILSKFDSIDPGTEVPNQPRWKKPRTVSYTYPLAKKEDPQKKCQICLAWLTADIRDSFEVLVLVILEQVLLGNAASPLRKALMDAELGSSLSDMTGFDADNKDTLFTVGLKNVSKESGSEIEHIIYKVLNDQVKNGIDSTLIESAIHQIEFYHKEITNTPYPFGLKLLLNIAGSWFHGAAPDRILNFGEDLKKLKTALSQGAFLEQKITRYFLENKHQVLLYLVPDQLMEEKETLRLKKELQNIKQKISLEDLIKIEKDTGSLEKSQETKEDISCLPTLQINDILPSVRIIKPTIFSPVLLSSGYNQATSDIFYFTSVAGINALTKEQLPLLPFFCYTFTKIGTTLSHYTEIARRIDACTGGLGISASARTAFNKKGSALSYVSMNGKSLAHNQTKMMDIISEIMGEYSFANLKRLKQLLLEYKAGLESMVVQNGHRLAISLASRHFSATSAISETWAGITQLQIIKKLSADPNDSALNALADNLTAVGKTIFKSENMATALIGSGEKVEQGQAIILKDEVLRAFNQQSKDPLVFTAPLIDFSRECSQEGWSTSTAVSFVASSFPTVRMQHTDSPALAVISKMLRSLYLHREIREKGGAYGGFALYNPENGLFNFASYRDPHIITTLNVFSKASGFLQTADYSQEDVKEAILQVCSEIDKPDPPGPAARMAFHRDIVSLSDEIRQNFKSGLLSLTKQKVARAAEKYFHENNKAQGIAVISGREKLEAANQKLGKTKLELHKI